jgi:hypothetical protein
MIQQAMLVEQVLLGHCYQQQAVVLEQGKLLPLRLSVEEQAGQEQPHRVCEA